jgi:dTDP-4-dehydrorhamnose reductase
MKKVLIFGANGMAGHMITLYLESLNKYDIIPVCYSEKLSRKSLLLDISNLEEVRSILQENKPDIIINCIGILNDKSDDNIPYTVYVNSFFPKFLEHYYHDTKTKIIHLSTDCVFRGIRGSYNEMDFKDEDSIYGLSKNFGEIDNDKDLTIRTSIIGPELKDGKGLFNWFMKSTGVIAGYTNVFWTGVTTLELAHIIDYALDKDVKGLYNVVPNSKISKYDLLNIIKNTFSKDDIEITEEGETKCDKSLVTIKGDFAYKVKSYEEMILELRDWMLTNIVFYPEYFNSKEKVIIIWSKIKAAGFEDSSKAKEWIEHRIKVFMKYTANSFKMQTNQNFIYFINYDDEAETYLLSELKKYPKLPDNIVFTKHYHQDIKEIIPYYKYLYFVRIDSDDMYEKNFIQKLIDFNQKR